MNPLSSALLRQAEIQALYCTFLYLAHKLSAKEGQSLGKILFENRDGKMLSGRNLSRFELLKNASLASPVFAESVLLRLVTSAGLNAAVFSSAMSAQGGEVSVVFGGTGSGEWLDNGEGLSGIPGENTYYYRKSGALTPSGVTISPDFATASQAEALNFFYLIASDAAFKRTKRFIVSGHSKGGNKAQFVALHSPMVESCFSFNGQGFSPEAIKMLESRFHPDFDSLRLKLFGFSAENDYVNVLGKTLIPPQNLFYFESRGGFHHIDSLFANDGRFNTHVERGALAEFVHGVSEKLMALEPHLRKNAALGVMNVFHRYFDKDPSDDSREVSLAETVEGIGVALSLIAQSFALG